MKFFYPAVCVLAAAAVAGTLYAQSSSQSKTKSTSMTSISPARKYSFAIVNPDGSINCSGSWNSDEFKRLKEHSKDTRMYVRKDGTMYVIEDKATIRQAQEAFKPLLELSKQHAHTGKSAEKAGQAAGEFGKKLSELINEQVRLRHELAGAKDEKERERIEAKIKDLAERQKELSKNFSADTGWTKEMGKQMGEWGRKMGEAGKEADAKVTKLIDAAFDKRLARKM